MQRRRFLSCAQWIAALGVGLAPLSVFAVPPEPPRLRDRIDAAVESAAVGLFAAPAHDAEFLRRISLDLVGMIPSAEEARAYLADASPAKREALVERLLADPRHARHLAITFDVAMMERRPDKHVPSAQWRAYLYESFLANKPYDKLVGEILSADGVEASRRAAARFVLDRECEPNLLARDVGRVFFGKDFQCCQCHDHPLVSDYYQADYYGLFTFFGRSALFNDEKEKKTVVADKAAGETSFVSVFDSAKTQYQGRPHVPGGAAIEEPTFKAGEEYVTKPAKNVRPVPKFSRRAQLAKQATMPGNRVFNENIVNRLWAMVMGRGLVEPVDMHHAGNPPSHPELLRLLGEEFQASGYDIRELLKELVLTRTYQRSIDVPQDIEQVASRISSQLAAWQADQRRLAELAEQAKKVAGPIDDQLVAARKRVGDAATALAQSRAAVDKLKKELDAQAAALATAQKELSGKQELAKSVSAAAAAGLEAAKKAPNDKELQSAAQKFQQRASELGPQIAALTKTVADRQATLDSLEQQQQAGAQSSASAETSLAEANRQVAGLVEQRAAAATHLAAAEASAERAGTRIADAKLVVEVAGLAAKRRTADEAVAAARRELEAAKTALVSRSPQIEKLAGALATAEKTLAEAKEAVARSQEQVKAAQVVATTVSEALNKTQQALGQLNDAGAQVTAMREKVAASEAAVARAEEHAKAIDGDLNDKRKALVECTTRQFALAGLKPLSAEPLAYSVMRAAGMVQQQQAAAEAEWAKKNPKGDLADESTRRRREKEVESAVHEKIAANAAPFLPLFAAGAGQPQGEFFATADQALFFANGDQIKGWLAPGGGNLAERLVKQGDAKLLAEELYLSVLTRMPTAEEIADVTKYLESRAKDRPAAVRELIWSLLTSTEFRFNH
jgi:hypothetical protein